MLTQHLQPVDIFRRHRIFKIEELVLLKGFRQVDCGDRSDTFMHVMNEFDTETQFITQMVKQTRNAFRVGIRIKIDARRFTAWRSFGLDIFRPGQLRGNQFEIVSTGIGMTVAGVQIFISPVNDGDGVAPAPQPPYQGLDHFGLVVKDLDRVAQQLNSQGVIFYQEPRTLRPGVNGCFIQGPDNIAIELLERRPTTAA